MSRSVNSQVRGSHIQWIPTSNLPGFWGIREILVTLPTTILVLGPLVLVDTAYI